MSITPKSLITNHCEICEHTHSHTLGHFRVNKDNTKAVHLFLGIVRDRVSQCLSEIFSDFTDDNIKCVADKDSPQSKAIYYIKTVQGDQRIVCIDYTADLGPIDRVASFIMKAVMNKQLPFTLSEKEKNKRQLASSLNERREIEAKFKKYKTEITERFLDDISDWGFSKEELEEIRNKKAQILEEQIEIVRIMCHKEHPKTAEQIEYEERVQQAHKARAESIRAANERLGIVDTLFYSSTLPIREKNSVPVKRSLSEVSVGNECEKNIANSFNFSDLENPKVKLRKKGSTLNKASRTETFVNGKYLSLDAFLAKKLLDNVQKQLNNFSKGMPSDAELIDLRKRFTMEEIIKMFKQENQSNQARLITLEKSKAPGICQKMESLDLKEYFTFLDKVIDTLKNDLKSLKRPGFENLSFEVEQAVHSLDESFFPVVVKVKGIKFDSILL